MNLPAPLKVVNVLAIALFGFFGWLQYNDVDEAIYFNASATDAILWLAFYVLIAVLFGLVLFRPAPRWLLVIGVIACLIEMGRTGPGIWENLTGDKDFTMMQQSMSAEDPRVELSREFFGAVIALAAVALLWWQSSRFALTKNKSASPPADGEEAG